MRILGINCLNHDAAVSVVEDGNVVFAAHSERYSRRKNDMYLNDDIMSEALSYGEPDKIAYYEKPWLKKSRQLYAKQYSEVFSTSNIPSVYLKKWIGSRPIHYVDHHKSHAASGYFTSSFDESVVVVIDGIGEWDVCSIWHGKKNKLKKVWGIKYPHSLGMFYSAMTKSLGLKPCEEEYILMGMSGWGSPTHYKEMFEDFFDQDEILRTKFNLHQGVGNYKSHLDDFDIASSTQKVTEILLEKIFLKAKSLLPHVKNLVYMGGVALNCVANTNVVSKIYDNVWIMPNPGDAGSSLGCAAFVYGKKINWKSPFLGTRIEKEYPVKEALDLLLKGEIVGIANGRSEFGPRALGNRSLLADPRGPLVKDKVNEIKKRQKFRPFAPSVLEDFAENIFILPIKKIPYMQFACECKLPDAYPAICHVDNTSRVQTVSRTDNPGYYDLINEFYKKTGCPMLLNTSLNIKGQPIVNNELHAKEFQDFYGVKVLC